MRLSLGIVVLLLAPSVSAAPWLQYGHDAARTGASGDAGPDTFDVAFHLALNATWEPRAPPLLVGREALVLTTQQDASTLQGATPQAQTSTLHAIDLDTARATPRLTFEGRASAIASDGELLFVARAADVAAYPLAGGEPVWTAPYPDLLPEPERRTLCIEPAVREHVLFLACTQSALSRDVRTPPDGFSLRSEMGAGHAFGWALDARTGGTIWTWDPRDDATRPYEAPSERDPTVTGGVQATAAHHLSVVGDTVTVVLVEGDAGRIVHAVPVSVWGLDAATGAYRWVFGQDKEISQRIPLVDGTDPDETYVNVRPRGTAPTGTGDTTYLKFGTFLWGVSTSDGRTQWSQELAEGPAEGSGSSLATVGGSIFAGSLKSVYRVDARTQTVLWRTLLSDTIESRLVVAGGHVYVRTWDRILSVLDADDGRVVWRMKELGNELLGRTAGVSVGEGVALFVTESGNVSVIGRTGASLVADVRVDSLYPPLGSNFSVDLSASGPGVFGAPTEFRADWGDGSTSEWQGSPVLSHAYEAAGDHVATFSVRNEAGQTASRTMTVHAGQTPETFLEEAFSAENQERTFFLLGLLVTLVAALVGVARLQRRRGRLQRELHALDAAYAATRARPLDCEAALAERRAHARGLMLDGKIDEGQLAILERRIDELAAALRIDAIDERFGFLSVSMARALREILADGRVTRVEREHLLVALDRDEILTREQKEKVRALIDEWFHRDARAGRPEARA